jgi:hypothetical protein
LFDFDGSEGVTVDLQIGELAIEGAIHAGAEPQGSGGIKIPPGVIECCGLSNRSAINMQSETACGLHRDDVMPSAEQSVIPGDLTAMTGRPYFAGG